MYFTLYFIVCVIAIAIGYNVYVLLKKNISGMFFMAFTIFLSFWFINYFLFFDNYFPSIQEQLYSSRINFFIGIAAAYNLLLFVTFYGSSKKYLRVRRLYLPIIVATFLLFTFTNLIISNLRLDQEVDAYREVYGKAYFIVVILYFIFAIGFIYISYHRISLQSGLDRVRLKKIVQATYLLFLSLVTFQVIFPLFDIWILEREIIFFYLAFVVRTYFLLRRYYFRGTSYNAGRILNMIVSVFVSITMTNLLQVHYLNPQNSSTLNYWISSDYYNIILIISGVSFFHLSYEILRRTVIKKFFGELEGALNIFIGNLQKDISHLTTVESLGLYINNALKKIIGIAFSEIIFFKNTNEYRDFQIFFGTGSKNPVFINDAVFLEENRGYFDSKNGIYDDMPKGTALVFPFFDETRTNIGLFILGQKPLGDFYTIDEIESLRQITLFIEAHIKYLKTYEQIQDLTRTLDKKVDEKTIQYNDLINKQKEFISTISHEIKSPIAGAILQTDSIIEDMDDEKISRGKIKEDLALLSVQLVKVGDLLSKLFSVQYYDTHAVTLFRERIQIQNMLNMELDIYESIHEGVEFERNIDSNMRFIEIDKIQFQQVLTNLLNNAVKFSESDHPIIAVDACIKDGNFCFSVEDNGGGFDGIEIENLFDKYAVGSSGSVGLGIGLYLCKRIVEMHGGKISASKGKKWNGAKISITIPI